MMSNLGRPYNSNTQNNKQIGGNAKNILSHRVSYDQYGNPTNHQTRNASNGT